MKKNKRTFFILILGLLTIFLGTYIYKTYTQTTSVYSQFELADLKEISKEDILNIKIVEKTFYSKKTVEKNDIPIFVEMINNINFDNISDSVLQENNYLFKIYIECEDSKFLIDVYGDDIISIYPWDGLTPKTFLSVSNLPLSIKTESICNYIFKK